MNKKNNGFLTILLIIIILGLIYMIVNQKIKNEVVAPGQETETSTELNELTIEEQEIISKFISENISELSPEKEVLGGKFYITSIDFIDGNNLIAGYEDGHIALMAEIEFEYLGENFIDEEGNNKIIEIKSFNIISE